MSENRRRLEVDYKQNYRNKQRLLVTIFFLITLTNFNIYLGFAIKPFMIFLILYFLFQLQTFQFQRIYWYERILILFYLFYCYTGAFSRYTDSSLRILLGFTILIFCYFIIKHAMSNVPTPVIERAVGYAGVLFNAFSLIYYVIGLSAFGFQFQGDRIRKFGVMLDRDYPRLIGTVPDPNFYIFYNTIFFTYFLCNRKGALNKVGLLLCILANILTFSRGGLLAMVLIVLIYFFMNNPIVQFKLLFGFITSLTFLGYFLMFQLNFDVMKIIESRISDFSNDGGSGRFHLWERAWGYFQANPLTGIGAFNFPNYNELHHGENIQVHNMFLDILAESGIIGFLLFLTFLLALTSVIIRKRIYKTNTYLFLSLIAIVLQLMSLSLIINEMLFLYLAVTSIMLTRSTASLNKQEAHRQLAYNRRITGKSNLVKEVVEDERIVYD